MEHERLGWQRHFHRKRFILLLLLYLLLLFTLLVDVTRWNASCCSLDLTSPSSSLNPYSTLCNVVALLGWCFWPHCSFLEDGKKMTKCGFFAFPRSGYISYFHQGLSFASPLHSSDVKGIAVLSFTVGFFLLAGCCHNTVQWRTVCFLQTPVPITVLWNHWILLVLNTVWLLVLTSEIAWAVVASILAVDALRMHGCFMVL